MASRLRFVPFSILLFAAFVLLGSGCSRTPGPPTEPFPPETVTLIITGVETDEQRKGLNKQLSKLVDTPGNFRNQMNWSSGKPLTVKLAPVASPGDFAERVDFGTVDRIENKTVYITYGPDSATSDE